MEWSFSGVRVCGEDRWMKGHFRRVPLAEATGEAAATTATAAEAATTATAAAAATAATAAE